MRSITLRNLPRELLRKIQERARADRTSATRAAIRILEESLGLARKPQGRVEHDDLDFLIGAWSRDRADALDAAIRDQRRIDPELWK